MGLSSPVPSGPYRRARGRPLLLAVVGMALLAGPAGFLWFLVRTAGPWPEGAPAPGIAVLTGGPDRVEAGFLLLAARPEARLIVSGAGPDVGLADLVRGAGAPVDPAALAGRVALGHTATSTRGNAREIAAWAGEAGLREITVVTAGFHMPRALLELRRDLPGAALRPHAVAPFVARPVPMLREYAKLLGALMNLSSLTERPREASR